MIPSNELRIGSLVSLAHESNAPIVFVAQIKNRGIVWEVDGEHGYSDFDLLMPIELTPEWLKRCGFKDLAGNGMAYRMEINLADELCWYMQDGYLRYQSIGNGFTRPRSHIKLVHQLQNFFYWHTGEELTIKP